MITTVRRLHPRDMDRAKEIDRLSFKASEQYDDSMYASMISDDRFEAFGGINERHQLLGYILLERYPAYRIRTIAVDPAHRSQGVAEALVRFIIERAPGPVDLLVDPKHTDAIRLYERLGFVAGSPDPGAPGKTRMTIAKPPA